MHAGAYGQSPALSATQLSRITRANESESMIRKRHAVGSYHAGDAARIKKLQMEQMKKEAGQMSDNEALVDIARNSKRTADALAE